MPEQDRSAQKAQSSPNSPGEKHASSSFVDMVVSGAAAKKSESRWMQPIDCEVITNCVFDAILVSNHRGHLLNCNSRACELLGYPMEKIERVRLSALLSGIKESELAGFCQNLQSDKRYVLVEAYCIRADGSRFPAEIVVSMHQRSPPQLCFSLRDITQRYKVEARLRTEHHALQNARDGIVITNEEALIEYANPAFAAMWGYAKTDELAGKNLRPMLAPVSKEAPPEQQPLLWWSLIVDHESWSEDLLAVRKDGSTFHVLANAACNRDAEGRVVGMVLSFTDLTDRNRAEEALRQAERQRAMLASVGAACHHLGQPATVLSTNIELVKRLVDGAKGPELKEILEQSSRAAEQISGILYKLNTVTEFKTVPYLEDDPASPENTILDI
ncbi:MAG TPA: PAS domain-containing protein [Kiritimatiellia bacterium]|nr:PAS domain-containing protein [Kiritimatiellia bacterium]HRZ12714.1 PAS domain-containing protein [Kiritimatiellia bacterium]HSA18334.1 PAS domain-containing protein [Kiritimatiellia bacterium]